MAEVFHRPVRVPGFVHDVTACRAFDMYGYAPDWSRFVKISLFNPVHVYKCADLLRTGNVWAGQALQTYESHIPYLLAFLADHELYGCNWLEFSEDAATERREGAMTVHNGREFDLDAAKILNPARFSVASLENQNLANRSFSSSFRGSSLHDSALTITSLSEARENDANWRRVHDLPPWTNMGLMPRYQQMSMDWRWERSGEYRDKLDTRINENKHANDGKEPLNGGTSGGDREELKTLPTAEELRLRGTASLAQPTQPQSESSDVSRVDSSPEDGYSAAPTSSGLLGATKPSPVSSSCESVSIKTLAALSAFTPTNFQVLRSLAPTTREVRHTNGVSNGVAPFFGNDEDVPAIAFTYGQSSYNLQSHAPKYLQPFRVDRTAFRHMLGRQSTQNDKELHDTNMENSRRRDERSTEEKYQELLRSFSAQRREVKLEFVELEYALASPSSSDVRKWLQERSSTSTSTSSGHRLKQSGPASYQLASLGVRQSSTDELSMLVVEVHVNTRPGKVPKASEDSVGAVFWRLLGTGSAAPPDAVGGGALRDHGVITTNPAVCRPEQIVVHLDTETALLEEVVHMVRFFNPDILAGFEIKSGSWGYLRARYRLQQEQAAAKSEAFESNEAGGEVGEVDERDYFDRLGRVRVARMSWRPPGGISGDVADDGAVVLGRHLLNLWDLLRHEVALSKYTLEYVTMECLHERTPHVGWDDLTAWWISGGAGPAGAVVDYWTRRVALVLRLFEHFEIVNRACEKSRVVGIDFLSSLTRGSQFQVEAMLCRLSRKQNYVLLSPSKAQVGQQNALEYIPLVMEPMSQYYTDPVCVLDFRSLYPSIVIAFNLCYSTCLGTVDLWRERNKLGVKQHHALPVGLLARIGAENIYVAPNGMAYVTPRVRLSLLAQMLGEILDTRFMVNATRKSPPAVAGESPRFHRNLNSKQLALKFIANVTYGYTSASFSGRMPFAELADSIVLIGREILEASVRMLEQPENKWGIQPRVVYGDTDSLFVRLPGVSRENAFTIGKDMADMVTHRTPDPILLKLEKVYSPCILLTKKRYVGNSFETVSQAEGTFDAKGIETVRRDGNPLVQMIERRALEVLFRSSDLSLVKRYLQHEWRRIWNNRVRVKDFCFAQEVRLGHYKAAATAVTTVTVSASSSTGASTTESNEGTAPTTTAPTTTVPSTTIPSGLPGGAVVSLRRMLKDDGLEPQYRERVPFVVTAGPPGSRITDRVVSPEEFMASPHLVIDYEYYIQKTIIPPLERLFNLMGANVRDWYTKMPRVAKAARRSGAQVAGIDLGSGVPVGGSLNTYLRSEMCVACAMNRRRPPLPLCDSCWEHKPRSTYVLMSRFRGRQADLASAQAACNLCSRLPVAQDHPCQSADCTVYYDRRAAQGETNALEEMLDLF